MRKLIVISFLTLDGVMQSPGSKDEDTEGAFEYGGWQIPYFADVDPTVAPEFAKAGALLLGRKTYDIFASYWPTVGKDIDTFGRTMNGIRKYVASRTLLKTGWENSLLLKGDVAAEVAKLKREEGKNIIVFGSGDLLQTLMGHNLIDEYFLYIHPMTLGLGKRLFQENGPKQDFELLKSTTSKNGVLVLNYKARTKAKN